MQVVVSDASPIHYLILIGEVDLLARLYGRVIVPETVASELQHGNAPRAVCDWISRPPAWVAVSARGASTVALSPELHAGEGEAILLALELRADLVLMDDRAGVHEAERHGLKVTGTLGLLRRAAEEGLIDLETAFGRLRSTNFRARPELLRSLVEGLQRRTN